MRPKVAILVIVAGIALAALLIVGRKGQKPITQTDSPVPEEVKVSVPGSQTKAYPIATSRSVSTREIATPRSETSNGQPQAPSATGKLERLAQTREYFRALAAGDHTAALLAAKAITNAVERET